MLKIQKLKQQRSQVRVNISSSTSAQSVFGESGTMSTPTFDEKDDELLGIDLAFPPLIRDLTSPPGFSLEPLKCTPVVRVRAADTPPEVSTLFGWKRQPSQGIRYAPRASCHRTHCQ
eukprot:m.79459 g.79459  ORF g.79459 m.79459 type:complete len:117 (+) comp25218_c1_seq2:127-477(+)